MTFQESECLAALGSNPGYLALLRALRDDLKNMEIGMESVPGSDPPTELEKLHRWKQMKAVLRKLEDAPAKEQEKVERALANDPMIVLRAANGRGAPAA
jgi:hypothetical protein